MKTLILAAVMENSYCTTSQQLYVKSLGVFTLNIVHKLYCPNSRKSGKVEID